MLRGRWAGGEGGTPGGRCRLTAGPFVQCQGKGARRLSEVGCAMPCRNSGQCGDSQAGFLVHPLKTRLPRAAHGSGRARHRRCCRMCAGGGSGGGRRVVAKPCYDLKSFLWEPSSECRAAARAPRSRRRGAMAGPGRSRREWQPRGLPSDRPAPLCPAGGSRSGHCAREWHIPLFSTFRVP